jgi:hypothetical protein
VVETRDRCLDIDSGIAHAISIPHLDGREQQQFIYQNSGSRVQKLVVKFLSPILKPLFRWNHEWTMKRGERQIAEYLTKWGVGGTK